MTDLEQAAARAVEKHMSKGTKVLGSLLIVRFDGCTIPVAEAEKAATSFSLNAALLPSVQDRSALAKALHDLGITPSASHGKRSSKIASAMTGEDSCLRYSRAQRGGKIVISIREEKVRTNAAGEIHIEDAGEVQELTYGLEHRKLEMTTALLRQEIVDGFARWKGEYKSDSIRSFVGRTIDSVGGVKFAGSTWFAPAGTNALDVIDGLRGFCRSIPGATFTAVAVLDEPGGKSDLVLSAGKAVQSEMDALASRLDKAEARKADGTKVKESTVDKILEDGVELRSKLQTLGQLLDMRTRDVQGKLNTLNARVRKFLES